MSEVYDVLIVDDEPVVRTAAARILSSAGLRVATASDAASALAHPAVLTARAVLLDVMLPDRSGLDVLRDLRARRPGLPVVLTTGYTVPADLAAAATLDGVHLLPKPFDEDELLAIVRTAVVPALKEAPS